MTSASKGTSNSSHTSAAAFIVGQSESDPITIPTLILVGRHDIVTPIDQARAIKNRMPNAQLVVFENSGHYPFYEENYLWTKWIYTFLTYYT